MTSESLRAGLVSEKTVKDALVKAKGDIFLAAGILNVSPREMDRYIRSSDDLQVFSGTIDKVKSNPEYEKYSAQKFREVLEVKMQHYRNEALDEIHTLATLPMEELNAAMADVKLRAAIKLLGDHNNSPVVSDTQNILIELNKQYQQAAPRIKSVRIAQIEYETTSSTGEILDALQVEQSAHVS